MLWIYARGHESLRIETRFDNEIGEYVLIFYRDGGSQQVERFQDPDSFGRRLEAVEQQLNTEAWHADGPPMVLRDGWKI